jgi:hypothetical protein
MAQAGFQKGERGGGVVAEIERGIAHGFTDFGESGEVHDGMDRPGQKKFVEEGGVGDVANHQASGGGNGVAMAAGEIIDDGDLEILLQEEADGGSADVASATGDQNVLRHTVPV